MRYEESKGSIRKRDREIENLRFISADEYSMSESGFDV